MIVEINLMNKTNIAYLTWKLPTLFGKKGGKGQIKMSISSNSEAEVFYIVNG
jgi:hypothetical protein